MGVSSRRRLTGCGCVCVRAPYAAVVVHVDVVQPAQVLVRLQEAGQLLVLRGRLGQQLPPLPFLHVPAEQEVSKVLRQEVAQRGSEPSGLLEKAPGFRKAKAELWHVKSSCANA